MVVVIGAVVVVVVVVRAADLSWVLAGVAVSIPLDEGSYRYQGVGGGLATALY